ncbi:dystonin isoform X27 [Anthonomus grandis grandis]|uniref:dystonin isoform X27 n=1 Tax=Anthonomus grandis grandis TaxID=2921223 RepID=UPI002166AEB1|nr:dystonin isoform X27 [Anthonomus grandis grandis]
MSTQTYYKDKLGFDPRESIYHEAPPQKYRKTEEVPHGYEENLTKFKDERDAVQKKTFTKWVNKHLKKAKRNIRDLFEDLRDGHNLISLLEVLTGEQLPRERGQMRFHMLHNIDTALHFLRCKNVKLVNIRSEDIVDGNPKLTLGLIWTIILHFQISDIIVGQEPNVSARDYLLRWAKRTTHKYPGVQVQDFTKSWRDGLAFSSILHRNRPDLIDWGRVRSQRPRERLETVFFVAEKEYGVTRLLDPEDVDTHEPDEKSLITYISSLHEVFPEPPPIHPLYDSVAQQKMQEYRELASSLHMWMRENFSLMQDRNFPPTLIEMKKLATESARFRTEEIPPRQRDKGYCHQLFRDLEKYFKTVGEVDIEPELHIENIERNWQRLMNAYQERDRHIIEEIKRLEKLQRLAEKVHREIKQTDSHLDQIEQAIELESRRIERLHPLEAKKVADQIDHELVVTEKSIQSLKSDVNTLRNGRYPQAGELDKRVNKLHDKWVKLRHSLHNKIVDPLANMSFPVEERTVTKQIKTVQETRNIENNPHFRSLQEHIDWCKNKLKQLKKADYGTDLSSVQQERDIHQREHKTIEQYHSKVEQCVKARQYFSGEELSLYNQHLGQLQKVYAELLSFSTNRANDLESLYDFIQSASRELQWLNEKEEIEVTRDWSDVKLDVEAVEKYFEHLMSDLEKREIQFNSILERGEALVLQNHPATKAIEAHLAAMNAQWAWLLQLTHCLETHLQNTRIYQQFFKDVHEAEEWIREKDEIMNTEFSQGEFSLDVGERLLQGMQALRDELNTFGDQVQTLVQRAQTVVPLKQRRQPITRPMSVTAICNYKKNDFAIERNKECTLTDNSGRTKWRVHNSKGIECQVPGVCFVLPPPDKDALDAVDRLQRQYDRSIALWQKKQLRMRQNMIFATIKVVKGWDLPQFIAIGAEQRNAIRKALNEDADKLIAEGDPSDPQLRRLRREMDEVNRLFDEFEKRARAEEESKNQSKVFNNQIYNLQRALDEAERIINQRVLSGLPRDVDTLQHLVLEHKEFESRLQNLEPEVEQVKDTFRSITLKTPQHKKDLEKVLDKWNYIWNTSNLYIERLKCMEIVLNGMEDAQQVISEFESKLASLKELPNTEKGLKAVHDDLLKLESAVGQQQIAMDQLNDDFDNARRLTEKSRPNQRGPHSDVERLDKDVQRLNSRWASVCQQLADRLRGCQQAYDLLQKYGEAKQVEDKWLDEQYGKLEALQPIKDRAKEHLDATRNLLNSVVERTPKIEQVNLNGGRFIREGKQAVEEKYKLCDETLSKLLHWIGEVEDRIASQDVIHEVEEDLRNQINIMKQIRDDLEQHAGQVSHCGDQVRQLVLTAGDILSKSEVSALEKSGRNLKTRFDKAIDKTEKLLRRQLAARDELGKLKGELNIFSTWLGKARRTLEDKERALSDLQRLDASTDSTREFVSDVIAHQADLRFITMSAQKFVDEGKEYLIILNDFRTSLPSRLPHIEPISSQDSPVRSEVSLVTQQYRDLLHRANNLSDRLSGVGGRQRDYSDALDKARSWLRDAEPRANKLLNEPIGGDPKTVEDQLHKAKSLNNEFVANGKLIDNAKDATSALVRSLEGQISPSEIHRLEEPVQNIENKYNQLSGAIANRCQELDTALIQSQGVQDALDGIIDWLNQAENQFKNMQRPASLIQERLDEQLREHRVFQSDIDTHISSIDSVYLSANELIVSTSNARVAKQIEGKLNDVKNRFEKLFDRVQNRGVLLAEVNRDLVAFNNQAAKFEKWYSEIMEIIESRELAKAPAEQYALQMKEISRNRDDNRALFEEVVGIGKELLNKRDVTDTSNVRDRVKSMESQWRDLENLMEEKTKLSKLRAEQHSAYETLKEQVLDWLTTMETKVARLDIVAIHLDTLRQQNDELKPITSEYKGYSSVIDKINDIGTAYDNLSRGDRPDSPSRRKGYSPTKRPMSGRRSSQDARSPSPTKGLSPLSTGGSSGFSSRRSSQDGFHLEELSPVQQQLSEINNRYSFLGVKINDRQSEIDSIRDELKKQLDNLKTLSSFLEKIHRQMPKDSVPNTKEEADKLNKQIKHVLEEMYEKQSLLDTTTSQVRDLLKRKAGAIGADNLNDELEEVLSHWKSINDYLKNRIKFMEDMKEFHDTHDSLNSWLGAKERMLTVLGPISSDSRMVQSQVQQVQVLREEFRSQQPQLQHLLDVGDDVLSYLEPRSSDHQKIDNKLTAIQQKWADILGKLDERADSLGAAADTSREFDAQLTRLKDALQGISDNLDEVSFEKDPEEQLRKVENLERQLEGQRPLLADLEANGAQLCEVLSDPASRADIQSKLASIGRQYNALQKKLDLKKAEIEGSLRDGRQFEASCAKTLGWLSDELGSLTERLLISADRDVLEQQLVNHEPIYRDVLAREHEVIMLLNKGREMVSRSTKADTRAVQRDLDKIQQSWEKLRKEAVDRQTRLKTCQEHCRKYYTTLESFLPWLRQAEDKIDSLRLQSFEKKHIEKQLRELQAFRNEVWKKSGEYENTRSLGETFLSSCDIDKEIVKNELQELKERWDKLNNDLILRTQALEDQSRKLGDFNENLRDLKHGLERCEDKLASHDALGGASRDPKLLDRIKALREETAGLKKPLQALKNQAEDLCHEAAENGIDANQLKDDVDSIGDRINDLQSKLNDRCLDLQSAATAVTQFNDKVKGLSHDLSALETELDNMKAPGRDIKTVRGQLDDVARFISKVAKAHNDVEDTILAGERLVDSGFAPDTAQTRQQVDALKRQLGKLDDRAHNREQELESALKKLEDFYIGHAEVLDGVKEASEQLRKLKPIGSDVEGIRAQQKDFKKFRASTVEPLNKSVETCNRFGQGLIQSAASGVNTQILEKDLEKMNDQWNTLKEKINDRERKLDIALLQSGKFQEALDGLSKWLADTEELVANQKAPSADYKVVKAQLQEQKFLKKMLLDRQNSMSSLFTMGNEIAKEAEPSERKAIEKQLKDLIGRFDALTEGAQQRTLDLEHAMKVAKEFQDKLTPLQDWLERSEKKVRDMELIPTDEEKIQQRIKEHTALHNDILSKKPDFRDLADVASNLMNLVGDDEAATLADKLTEVTDRYGNLVDASENIRQLLEASRKGLRTLVLTYQDLAGWMDAMEQRLARYKVLAVHTDRLLEQMDDLVGLTEDIVGRQKDIDDTVDAGIELMRHISSDEALQLKDKLDSLQRRYNDLTSRGNDLLKNAQALLPLVQKFHNNHNRLVEWMQGAESILQSAEPNEGEIARLEVDLQELRPVLETINVLGPQLCQASPGEGAATIEGLVSRDNRRFDAIAEQIQRRAERIHLGKQRALEVTGDIDELLEWFREVEAQIKDAEKPSAEPDLIRVQLKEHKALNDDISSQKGRVRDVLSTAKKVLRESPPSEDTSLIREKMEDLREAMDNVSALSSDRLGILEQALPLAEHFNDTHIGLLNWLGDIEQEVSMLTMPALRPEAIQQQQDKNEMLVKSIHEHKPLVDKLNKTGEALIRLCNEDDGSKVQEILDSDNARYAALKLELRERERALEQAMQESSQFSDKLEGMLRALTNTADQVNNQEPISAHVPKIRDQIDDNDAIVSDLNKRKEAYAAVQRAADDVITKAGNRADPAVKDIRHKLDRLKKLWDDVQRATKDRGHSLDDALDAAQKFWKELHAIMATLKDLEDSLVSQEPPAVEPKAIQEQQVALQEIRQEIDQTKPEVDQVRSSGKKLMKLCGEPDKPEVKKHIEDLDNAWDNITALYAKREENLIDAMEKAMEFHETLQDILAFLDKAEKKFDKMGPLGADIDAVKRQIDQLKAFKAEVDPHMVKVEALNRQAQELTERTSADQAASIKEPLSTVNRRWDDLLRGMVERQRQLENALLRLGQFQHALNELLVWISKTDKTLDELKPVAGDAQTLEIELAKLKVLINDIQAHQTSVDTLNDAGRQIIESGEDRHEASATQEKLNTLNTQWRALVQKAADRQRELEDALSEAHSFNQEVQDLLAWLGDVDNAVAASKPVGGLPETASEQLERFMEVYNEIEDNRPKVETVLAQGQEYLKKAPANSASNLQHNLRTLKQRWDSVTARANDKKIKLEIALKEATEFHESLQAFVDWLTNAEKILTNLKPVSRVLDTVQHQIEEHKIFQKDVSAHREIMLALDKKGTHLKYFSQKQDVILIKNLLISVQHRWERVASKSAERTRALDLGYKEAKEFHDSWAGLMNWLEDTEQNLEDLMNDTAGNDPEKIKARLAKHTEFQRALSGKQATYDAVMKSGKNLKDKAPKFDENTLKQMLQDLKNKWTSVCNKSRERQQKLEEALLYSGQFKDAVAALLEWLKKAEKELSQDSPVHGDLDTVTHLIDIHRQFEKELEQRNDQMESVMRSGQELERTASKQDAAHIRHQLTDLTQLWESVTGLTHLKTDRLHDALKEAEKLHKSVNMILDWLSDAEMKLRFVGNAPEDESAAYEQLKALDEFRAQLNEKEIEKDQTLNLAHNILAKAHPDSINVIKNWIKVIKSRWEEVSQWALQRHQKISAHMQSLRDMDETLEELIQWLLGLENTLIALKKEELPMDISATEQLIADHKEFMENTQRRQAEVDKVCKAKQVKIVQPGKDPRKFGKGKGPIRGSQHDLHETSSEHGTLGRKQSFKGSRDLLSQRGSRVSPGRELSPDPGYPHIGPRFPPAGSEPEFRSPRVKFLYDKWRHVWVLSWERQRELYDHLAYLKEKEKADNFSWDDWRKRFLKFMNYKKSRLTDLFRKMDKDNNELIPREDFIDGIIKTKFDTSRLEMKHVADMFDENNRGLIDWKKFIAALRPDWEEKAPDHDAQKIHDEVKRLVMLCTCRQKFRVFQVGEGKYRFGDSQKLRLVRILRSTVMVRVGGGWVALDEFLLKNDPCRAKGRTNIELREQFILADGVSQTMTAFKSKRSSASPVSGSSSSSLRTPQGPITKVRERSQRSVPMGSLPRTSKSSLSAGTPDSLSDNESGFRTPRKPSYRSNLTPGGSRSNSRPASRTGSRPGSKPPSRHGSNLSLDSTDDTPSRIPRRTPTTSGRSSATLSSARKTAVNGTGSRPRTPSGLRSPASPALRSANISRASSIPTLTGITPSSSRSRIPIYRGNSKDEPETSLSTSSSCSVSLSSGGKSTASKSKIPLIKRSASSGKVRQVTIGVAPTLRTASRTRTPSGSNTPVHPEQATAVSRLLRKNSGASETPTGQARRKKISIEEREPFRL